jgi:hypothetical protein
MFFEGSAEQAMLVKDVLDDYERCTGQLVSLGKCSILFGAKCFAEAQASIKEILKRSIWDSLSWRGT